MENSLTYFDKMNITESEKEDRKKRCAIMIIKLTTLFEWFSKNKSKKYSFITQLEELFLMWGLYAEYITEQELVDQSLILENLYNIDTSKIVGKKQKNNDMIKNSSISDKVKMLIEDADMIYDTTVKHIDDDKYLSEKRAENIAHDETNKYSNIMMHEKAIRQGYKYHVWNTKDDSNVRESHSSCNGQKKLIGEPFIINGYMMMHPMDTSFGAPIEEIAGCRCSESFE